MSDILKDFAAELCACNQGEVSASRDQGAELLPSSQDSLVGDTTYPWARIAQSMLYGLQARPVIIETMMLGANAAVAGLNVLQLEYEHAVSFMQDEPARRFSKHCGTMGDHCFDGIQQTILKPLCRKHCEKCDIEEKQPDVFVVGCLSYELGAACSVLNKNRFASPSRAGQPSAQALSNVEAFAKYINDRCPGVVIIEFVGGAAKAQKKCGQCKRRKQAKADGMHEGDYEEDLTPLQLIMEKLRTQCRCYSLQEYDQCLSMWMPMHHNRTFLVLAHDRVGGTKVLGNIMENMRKAETQGHDDKELTIHDAIRVVSKKSAKRRIEEKEADL